MNGSSGWLTAKKRGRDDAQIKRDKEIALQQRKNNRKPSAKQLSKQPVAGSTKGTNKSLSIKNRSKKIKRSSLETLDSMDDFVADDDDEGENDSFIADDSESAGDDEASFIEDDDDDEEDDGILDDDNTSSSEDVVEKKAAKSLARKPYSKDDDSSTSDSLDEAHVSFLPKTFKKAPKSKALPLPSQRGTSKIHSTKTRTDRSTKVKKNPLASFAYEGTSKTLAKPKSVPIASSKLYSRQNVISLENSDIDKSPSLDASLPRASSSIQDDDSSSMMSESKLFAPTLPTRQQSSNKQLEATSHELEDTPVLPQAIRKKILKRYQGKEKAPITGKGVEKKKLTYDTKFSDDYISDEDEAIAIAYAIEESTKTISSKNKKKASNVVYKIDVSDTDDDDDGKNEAKNEEMVADYVDNDDDDDDEDARAAKSILETANELSLRILRTMAGWAHSAIDGMIVDGALALSTITNANNDNNDDLNGIPGIDPSDHTWISNETMNRILPNVKLSEYQLIGVNWIALLHGMKCEVEGTKKYTNVNGILADEMGLGKTCQTIAFLSWLKHNQEANKEPSRPHLVIAPASVVSNWELEFQKFAPHLNIVKYHGSMNERMDLQLQLKKYLNDSGKRSHENYVPLDVIIAPVTYFQQEKSDDRYFLKKFQYDYMIVDEAHLLKNSRGLRYKSLDRFKTMHRLLLTGTPVQNSPKELMSLLCFLMPLFSRKSSDEFDETQGHDGGESMLQYFVSIQEDNDDVAAYKKLKQLFSPFVLRRRKEDVLSQILPPKEQRVEFVELDPLSRVRYNEIIADHVENKKKGSTVYEHLFTQLRKAAHHPLMLRSRYVTKDEKEHLNNWFYQYGAFRGDGCTKAKVAEETEKYSDFEIHLTASELIEENPLRANELRRYVLDEQDLFCSAKFVRLRELLPELIRDGHRILLFSVWTTCLDLLGCLLEQMGLQFLRMDGQTAVSDRQSLIHRWNENPSIPVFLLSTKACGLGLNLTSADTCIQHDLDFNPFNDLQAEDRCHRIGQTKKVTIIKMVSKDTVDEDIYMMQQRKAKMNAAIMGNDVYKKPSAGDTKHVLEIAVNRYLQSPNGKKKPPVPKENLQNVELIEIL